MEIVNTTVCAAASVKINLCCLINCVPLRTFDAVHYKTAGTTCVIFHSGKINCLGAKSLEDAVVVLEDLQSKLRLELYSPSLTVGEIRLTNVVAHYNLIPAPLDLDILYNYWKSRGVKGRVLFEPELYPALKLVLPKGTLLVYHSGKVLLTGVKDINHLVELQEQFNESVNWLLGFHSVVMADPRPKRQPKKVKPVDDISKLLEDLVSELAPPPPPPPPPPSPQEVNNSSTIGFALCNDCLAAARAKRKHWRKRKDKHQATISMCDVCFKLNIKVLQKTKCNPAVLDHIGGPNCLCWETAVNPTV